MRDPLLAPLAAIAAGIVLSRRAAFTPAEAATGIAAFMLLAAFSLYRRFRAPALVSGLAALFLLGAALPRNPGPPAPPPRLVGCVVTPAIFSEDRQQFIVEFAPSRRARVSSSQGDGARLHYGQRVEIDGRLRRPRNFDNPGAFDFVRYLARRDIHWTLAARQIRILPGSCGDPLHRAVYTVRAVALERLERLHAASPYHAAMMKALLLGDDSAVDKVWIEEFRSTGTVHALVISGSHVAILAAVFLFLLRLAWVPRTAASTATFVLVWLYAVLTGWEAPVVRSAAGMSMFLVAGFFFRQARVLNLLAAAGIAFLLLDPESLFDASFQLSFLSVAFLGAFGFPILERAVLPWSGSLHRLDETRGDLKREPRLARFRVELRLLAETIALWTRCPPALARALIVAPARVTLYLAGVILTSAVVQVGLALPLAIYFHRVSATGLSANALVIPLMAAIVPLGFLAISTGLAPAAALAAALLDLCRAVVAWHARFEPAWR
ncbi:MAG: ComEC/Rec2 family competence protein, partial [Bryobacteraceae bacterium]